MAARETGAFRFYNKGGNMEEGMTKNDWEAKDMRILKTGVVKSLLESGRLPMEGIAEQKEWLKGMFDYAVSLITNGNAPFSTGNIPPQPELRKSTPIKAESTKGTVPNIITTVARVSQKEYKPGKYLYGIQDSEGTWYSTFFKIHFDTAAEAKNAGSLVKIFYEVSDYKGKPQRNIQSIEVSQ